MEDPDRFSPWFPLDTPAPDVAGVVQLKVVGELIRYPRGASAMIRYDAGDSVAAIVLAAPQLLAGRWLLAAVRWRYQALPVAMARAQLARLRGRSAVRFGALPSLG